MESLLGAVGGAVVEEDKFVGKGSVGSDAAETTSCKVEAVAGDEKKGVTHNAINLFIRNVTLARCFRERFCNELL